MNWDWDKLKDHQQQQHGGPPPQFDEILNKIKDIKFPGGPLFIVVILLAFISLSCFFTVGVDEEGVVQRFGRYVRTNQPGLGFKLPMGIEKVTKVKVRLVYKAEFESGPSQMVPAATRFLGGDDAANPTLMLTGDLNVAVVPWIVQYRIKEPYDYLFKVKNVEVLLSDLSEAAMRLVVGDRSINEVITKRDEIAIEAKEVLQRELDNANAGIAITTIEMKKTNVPDPVQPSFNEVNQAVQDKETMIYQAKEDYNKALPEARGEAERTIRAAEGYAMERVNLAKGDASRFLALYREYAKAKDITKRRMYLETIAEVFPALGKKYIVDSEQKNLLPLLNLGNESGVTK
ncbi:MAG: FtsH protease activity modulator HflK [Desulfobacterales bacterium]|jgi:membrane protease subunit HflK|nr:FtsH protease activity modulator HflK [Desulfobacterales bacterium]